MESGGGSGSGGWQAFRLCDLMHVPNQNARTVGSKSDSVGKNPSRGRVAFSATLDNGRPTALSNAGVHRDAELRHRRHHLGSGSGPHRLHRVKDAAGFVGVHSGNAQQRLCCGRVVFCVCVCACAWLQ